MKRNIGILWAMATVVFMTWGCMKKMATPPPPPPPETILGDEGTGSLQESLFKGDQTVLSDQDIARILGTQLALTDRHRLAILNLSSNNYLWSEELADIETKNFDNLLGVLKSSPQLTDVRLLPSLLVPEKRTVPYLREAAARVQADLLFVYTTRIQTFQRERFLKAGEVHARCVAESVLLDVRTGIVVQTGRATENIDMMKTPSDLNFGETLARAESEARGKAVVSLANALIVRLAQDVK
ncbi:MAG TPA: hypothetical protein VNH65_19325 [Candidatus Acidoferrum sp.]|nr:hypothetical protein [Candidatus Acidoferrum sp.]